MPLRLIAFLLLGCTVIACSKPTDSARPTEDLFVLSAAEHYDHALQRAIDWRDDAYLTSIGAGPGSARVEGDYASLMYTFESPSRPTEFHNADLWGGVWTCYSERQSRLSFTGLPIERRDWVLDSVDAWTIAQANGAQDLLRKHSGSDMLIIVQLDRFRVGAIEDVLVWRVVHSVRPHVRGGHLDILIDPETGDILDVQAK